MKPMIILPPDVMAAEEIEKLNTNGLCVVVASDPAKVRFVDPIPAASSRTQIESAAIKLSRVLLHGQHTVETLRSYRSEIGAIYASILIEGTALDATGGPQEREAQVYSHARDEEIRKIAREDARAEKAKKKAAAEQIKK